jgi:tRNA C32,U32 (ribose-2'-O)-methylase TrmJ
MEPIPLPSYIHYELLLQLLERQTSFAVNQKPAVREQVHQLIATLRKALAQQKQLEQACQRANLPVEYRWSLNSVSFESEPTSDVFPLGHKPEVSK